jgi:hypothetical protein
MDIEESPSYEEYIDDLREHPYFWISVAKTRCACLVSRNVTMEKGC